MVRKTIEFGLASALVIGMAGMTTACRDVEGMDPADPGRGPGQLVGNGPPINDLADFRGGDDPFPDARDVTPPGPDETPDCDDACRTYCDGLGLENPLNVGVCASMWGVGIPSRPLDRTQSCRRLYVDMLGRYPTPAEVNDVCDLGQWGETVRRLLDTEEFAYVNQRKWADKLLYNNRTVNVERAYDADDLVRKTMEGRVPWDQFAAVVSAHPILTRRHDTAADRADALFQLFLLRPAYQNERADLARLYRLWSNGYWEHPHIGRVPDAYINYECTEENADECTSILWGYNRLLLTPDKRTDDEGDQEGWMWSGYLTPEEWEKLQEPGRIIASDTAFWEAAVDQVMIQYLGYDLGTKAPEVRHEMVKYLLEYGGDIRAVHFAVATSVPYLQSSIAGNDTDRPWTYGPLKQIEVEPWLDSIKHTTGYALGTCDHRMPHPEDYLEADEDNPSLGGWAYALVRNSEWVVTDDRSIRGDYRGIAQTLGGCPLNEVASRYTTVSILNTAVQEGLINEVCDPGLTNNGSRMDVSFLLPNGMTSNTALTPEVAEDIVERQVRLFFGRELTPEERQEAADFSSECTPQPCDAEAFARPVCFALLSSSEMLFY